MVGGMKIQCEHRKSWLDKTFMHYRLSHNLLHYACFTYKTSTRGSVFACLAVCIIGFWYIVVERNLTKFIGKAGFFYFLYTLE